MEEQKPSTSFLESLPVYAPTTIIESQPPRCLQMLYCRRQLTYETEESKLAKRVYLLVIVAFSLFVVGVVVFIIMDMCGLTGETAAIIDDFVLN